MNTRNIHAEKVAALYIRVSTDAQAEEGFSIPAQQERLEAYCVAKGWPDFQIYVDPGFSGSNLNRPQIQQLMHDVKDEKIHTVIVYKLDRLSRSQKDTLFLIEDVFLPNQVDFISLNECIDTSTPYGRAMIGILSAFAQLERENIYLRTRMGMLERVKQGYWMGGGGIPFGYDYDRNTGTLVPKPGEAETVRKIYDLFIKGYSCQSIATMLDLKYDRLVAGIITRKVNIGIISYKGEEYKGRHQPLVSEEVFNLAQNKMRERSEKARVTTNHSHLLTGLIYCGSCGSRLRYVNWGKNRYKLMCYSKDKSKPYMSSGKTCSFSNIWADEVETIVIEDLFSLSTNLEDSDQLATTRTDPLAELDARIKECENRIKRLYNLYASGGDEFLLETINDNKAELIDLKEQYALEAETNQTRSYINLIYDQVVSIRDTWSYLDNREKQELIRACIEKIVISDEKIEIFYSFIRTEKQSKSA